MSDPTVFDPHGLSRRDLAALHAHRAALADAAGEHAGAGLAVRVGDKRYVSPAVGRTFRQALKKPRSTRELAMTPVPGEGLVAEEGMSYADYVEDRLREMVAGARSRRRVKIGSPEQAALAADVVRRPALVQLGLVVGAGLVAVLSLLLG